MCEILLMQEPREVPQSCEIRYIEMATTIFHKLRHKNEWLYVTNNDSLFVTCDEDKESRNHILEGAGIIALNETCQGYANRDVLIPGRLSKTSQYTDFVPTSMLRDSLEESPNSEYSKIMQDHHIKSNQMKDLNDNTFTREQVYEQIQRKGQYELLEAKVYTYIIIGGASVIICITINLITVWFIRHETTKQPRDRPGECPTLMKDSLTQTPISELTEEITGTAPPEAEVVPEEVSRESNLIYPKLRF